jgi:hypothetical protein
MYRVDLYLPTFTTAAPILAIIAALLWLSFISRIRRAGF